LLRAAVDTREEFEDLAGIYVPVGIAVAAVIFGLVAFALIRYRRRDDRLPGQRESMTWAEASYALLLAVIVAVLLVFSFRATDDIAALDDDPGVRVDVTAFQWNWRFTYPGEGVTVVGTNKRPATLVVPSDRTVRFSLTSRDVIHAFWIPEVRFKRDAFPKRETEFDLTFDERGESIGRCAEFCGLDHDAMTFDVVVMEPDEFESWLETQRGS
jgi:cytochrome c oxidase subunit 2